MCHADKFSQIPLFVRSDLTVPSVELIIIPVKCCLIAEILQLKDSFYYLTFKHSSYISIPQTHRTECSDLSLEYVCEIMSHYVHSFNLCLRQRSVAVICHS